MKKFLSSLFCMGLIVTVFAQDSTVAVADREARGLRADGKIYVVIAVVLTILFGLFLYLIRLDRKITRLEKNSPPK